MNIRITIYLLARIGIMENILQIIKNISLFHFVARYFLSNYMHFKALTTSNEIYIDIRIHEMSRDLRAMRFN